MLTVIHPFDLLPPSIFGMQILQIKQCIWTKGAPRLFTCTWCTFRQRLVWQVCNTWHMTCKPEWKWTDRTVLSVVPTIWQICILVLIRPVKEDRFEDLGVDGRIILKWIEKKSHLAYDLQARIKMNWQNSAICSIHYMADMYPCVDTSREGRPLWRPRRRWEDNIKMNRKEIALGTWPASQNENELTVQCNL